MNYGKAGQVLEVSFVPRQTARPVCPRLPTLSYPPNLNCLCRPSHLLVHYSNSQTTQPVLPFSYTRHTVPYFITILSSNSISSVHCSSNISSLLLWFASHHQIIVLPAEQIEVLVGCVPHQKGLARRLEPAQLSAAPKPLAALRPCSFYR